MIEGVENVRSGGSTALVLLEINVAYLKAHCIVVVVHGHLGVKTGLFSGTVVFGVEFNVGKRGSLEVGHQREGEGIIEVGLQATVAVIHVSLHRYGVGGVVLKVLVDGAELDVHVCGTNGATLAVRLADIVIGGGVYYLAGGVLGDLDHNLIGVPEQTRPDEAQRIDGVLLVGEGDVFSVCGDLSSRGILNIIVGTEVGYVVTGGSAYGSCGVSVGKSLVQKINRIVQLVLVGCEVVQVENGSDGPVAVECEVGNREINGALVLCIEGKVALHVHTVLERVVKILLVCIGELQRNLDLRGLSGIYRNGVAVSCAVLDGNDGDLCTLEHVCGFGHGGVTLVGEGLADTLGEHVSVQVVGESLAAEVLDGKHELVLTGLLGIVAKLDLGFLHFCTGDSIVSNYISVRSGGISEIGKSGALLSDGVGQTVFIDGDGCGGHHQSVDGNVDLLAGQLGETLHNVLTEKCGNAGDVGRRHRSTGDPVVGLTGYGGKNGAAVCGDLRLDSQVGCGTPRGEVGHEGTGCLRYADLDLSGGNLSQHLTVILGDRANGKQRVTYVHLDITRDVVVDDNACRALSLGNVDLFLEGGLAASDKSDLALDVYTGVVSGTSDAGDGNVFNLALGSRAAEQIGNEILFL